MATVDDGDIEPWIQDINKNDPDNLDQMWKTWNLEQQWKDWNMEKQLKMESNLTDIFSGNVDPRNNPTILEEDDEVSQIIDPKGQFLMKQQSLLSSPGRPRHQNSLERFEAHMMEHSLKSKLNFKYEIKDCCKP